MLRLRKTLQIPIGLEKCKEILETEINVNKKIDMEWPIPLLKYRIMLYRHSDDNMEKLHFSIMPKYFFWNNAWVLGKIIAKENCSIVTMRKFPMIIPYAMLCILIILSFFSVRTLNDFVFRVFMFLFITPFFLLNICTTNKIVSIVEDIFSSVIILPGDRSDSR